MPEFLRAYGEILKREEWGTAAVLVTLAVGASALLVLFAVGSALGRLRRAWWRARRSHSHQRR